MMSLWDALRMNMMISYQELVRTFLIISLWLQIKHIIFLCVPFLRKPYFMRIMSRQKSINKRASQCG
ncbi:ydjO [Escherichia coli]|nr:ydjO [Escherichia coli]CTY86731.1 ydjO [Escherichia coli]